MNVWNRTRAGTAAAVTLGGLPALAAPGCGGGGGSGGFKGGSYDFVPEFDAPPPIVGRISGTWQGETTSTTVTPPQPVGATRISIEADGKFTGTIRNAATGEEGAFVGTVRNYSGSVDFDEPSLPTGEIPNATLAFSGDQRYVVFGRVTLDGDGHLTGDLSIAFPRSGSTFPARLDLVKQP